MSEEKVRSGVVWFFIGVMVVFVFAWGAATIIALQEPYNPPREHKFGTLPFVPGESPYAVDYRRERPGGEAPRVIRIPEGGAEAARAGGQRGDAR